MKCDEIKEKLIDLVYDEVSAEEKKKLKAHLRRCKNCKKEYMELVNTSKVLRKWKAPEPSFNFIFIKERISVINRLKEWFRVPGFNFKKFGIAFGGIAVGLLIILSLVNFEVNKTENGLSISMGIFKKSKSTIDERALLQQITKVQQETIHLFTRIMEERELAQRRDYQLMLAEIVRTLENKQKLELSQLESALIESYTDNSVKIERTNEVLKSLISTANFRIEKK
ncbi:hypothetical protein DRQ09_01730 [candidate division KSB1 bacterium]|nr:MAG: hypothetical protein DRQ09_01730 [candidate division KSB1 bacterium]